LQRRHRIDSLSPKRSCGSCKRARSLVEIAAGGGSNAVPSPLRGACCGSPRLSHSITECVRHNSLCEVPSEPTDGGSKGSSGAGLGLAIVAEIMKAHQDSVSVDDNPCGGAPHAALRPPPGQRNEKDPAASAGPSERVEPRRLIPRIPGWGRLNKSARYSSSSLSAKSASCFLQRSCIVKDVG
jgi:hypothetical protein